MTKPDDYKAIQRSTRSATTQMNTTWCVAEPCRTTHQNRIRKTQNKPKSRGILHFMMEWTKNCLVVDRALNYNNLPPTLCNWISTPYFDALHRMDILSCFSRRYTRHGQPTALLFPHRPTSHQPPSLVPKNVYHTTLRTTIEYNAMLSRYTHHAIHSAPSHARHQ